MQRPRVIVIGAGIGGLVAAIDLARAGLEVTVLERSASVGGKLRAQRVDGARIDAGPTVLTMRDVFEQVFADAGSSLAQHLTLRPLDVLARHWWPDGSSLDLHADVAQSSAAIGALAGTRAAEGYRSFCERASAIYATLDRSFIRAPRTGALGLTARCGLAGLGPLWKISPFASLWDELGRHFRDPRLRQLFARYSTYMGASPWRAPATLMLIAHVERCGVWTIDGGIHELALALGSLARELGVQLRFGAEVAQLVATPAGPQAAVLADGERIAAARVVFNGDPQALAAGLLGQAPRRAVPAQPAAQRSMSALTWSMFAPAGGVAGARLAHHNVFFGADYAEEFDAVFRHGRLPRDPTVYVCAQDRPADPARAGGHAERLFCLVNAPANGDVQDDASMEIDQCESRTFQFLAQRGLELQAQGAHCLRTTPVDFARMFPGTGGALYGRASHGWRASFQRPGARTSLPGLYLAGGGTHPGAGMPMAAVSGRLAAASLVADLGSTYRSWRTATPGGISTHSVTTRSTV
jgi:1-hydroxycarotenoid 3,4-desaturase